MVHIVSHLADEVVGLADKDGLVRVVVAQSEALVGVAPGQVPVGVARAGDEDLVLLDGVDDVAAVGGALDLAHGALQLLDRAHRRPKVGQVVEEYLAGWNYC